MGLTKDEIITEFNRHQEKDNLITAELKEEITNLRNKLYNATQEVEIHKNFIRHFKQFFRISGILIIIFDIVKDHYSELHQIRHAEGWGWQQIGLGLFGVLMIFMGLKHRRGK